MNPKEKLSKDIVELVSEFYEKTGVAVEEIMIPWADVTPSGKVSREYVIGSAIGMRIRE